MFFFCLDRTLASFLTNLFLIVSICVWGFVFADQVQLYSCFAPNHHPLYILNNISRNICGARHVLCLLSRIQSRYCSASLPGFAYSPLQSSTLKSENYLYHQLEQALQSHGLCKRPSYSSLASTCKTETKTSQGQPHLPLFNIQRCPPLSHITEAPTASSASASVSGLSWLSGLRGTPLYFPMAAEE